MEITNVNVHQKSRLLSTKWLDITAPSQFSHAQILYRNKAATLAIASHKLLTQTLMHDKTANSANTSRKHKPQNALGKPEKSDITQDHLPQNQNYFWTIIRTPWKLNAREFSSLLHIIFRQVTGWMGHVNV